jgi:GT2 family glycosyltransferase
MSKESLAIAICTRNRPDYLLQTASYVLDNGEADSVIIIDQSEDAASRDVLKRIGAFQDRRVRYSATPLEKGLSRARNIALGQAERIGADIVAFTDDDCIVGGDWAGHIRASFAANPSLDILFAGVSLPDKPPDQHDGWTPTFEPTTEGRVDLTTTRNPEYSFGIGANMALRRGIAQARVGLFDVHLGAGSELRSGEDTDYGYRAYKRGLGVYVQDEPSVIHLGARAGASLVDLRRSYVTGMAGYTTKHMRLGDSTARNYLAKQLLRDFGLGVGKLVTTRRPSGLRLCQWILAGVKRSFASFDVDPVTQLYRPKQRGC